MADFAKYRAAVISKAEYDTEGVGYSTVMSDFPFELGPDVLHDTLTGLRKPWGRDDDGLPLLVTEVTRYKSTVTTHGVTSSSDFATPTKGTIPAASIAIITVSAVSVLAGIDAAAKHFVLGVDPTPLDDPEASLPAGLQPYAWNVAIPANRWTALKAGLVSLGVDGAILDTWKSNNPDATPRDFGEAFKAFIK